MLYYLDEDIDGFGSTEFFVFRKIDNISDSDYIFYFSLSDFIRKPAEASMFGVSGRQRADLDFIKKAEKFLRREQSRESPFKESRN